MKSGRLFRVEVRTGFIYSRLDGEASVYAAKPDNSRYDIWAICLAEGGVVYNPALLEI